MAKTTTTMATTRTHKVKEEMVKDNRVSMTKDIIKDTTKAAMAIMMISKLYLIQATGSLLTATTETITMPEGNRMVDTIRTDTITTVVRVMRMITIVINTMVSFASISH